VARGFGRDRHRNRAGVPAGRRNPWTLVDAVDRIMGDVFGAQWRCAMCGVVGIVYGQHNPSLGRECAALLRKLEYRGYDSTGAAFIHTDGSVTLKKKVGAPSSVVEELEIEADEGQRLIGQVRWATYGSVTDVNAQPHQVACRHAMVGAHNGNISNTDTLKEFLADADHEILSDNDGEMLVHTVEHYYHAVVEGKEPKTDGERVRMVINAIRRAQKKIEGSFAACVAFPDLPGIFAMKSGSSLYAGKGSDAAGDFIVVSSDLTSVLSKTRFLIPLAEGEVIYFTEQDYLVFSLHDDTEHRPGLKRSRLNIADISLQSRYKYYMHQEIYTASENVDKIIKYYFMEKHEKELFKVFEGYRPQCKEIIFDLLKLYEVFDLQELDAAVTRLVAREDFGRIHDEAVAAGVVIPHPGDGVPLTSDEGLLLTELLQLDHDRYQRLWILDQIVIWKKKRKVTWFRNEMTGLIKRCHDAGGRVFAIGAGTSYHASLVGAYLFNRIAGASIVPLNPGMFRSLYLDSLTRHDIVIGVTQSGETKDLLDIFNDVKKRHGDEVHLVSMVNNELSSIPQEKSDFFLPILCGPEIAVAATKSFISQVALFHLLACAAAMPTEKVKAQISNIRSVIDFTLKDVEEATSEVALKMFLKPSMHILGTSLIGLAREGALKVREVVLNHTEGYDSAEFKHGPNTILGKNTIFSLTDMQHLLEDAFEFFAVVCEKKFGGATGYPDRLEHLIEMFKDIGFLEFALDRSAETGEDRQLLSEFLQLYKHRVNLERYFSNYPLIFFCPPTERDIKITISQIHTHKIRGADIVLIAQDDEELRKAVEGKPAEVDDYYCRYIKVPKMFDETMFVYQAAVVLQLLALKMSVDKMKFLNKHHVANHGVHPDVPKNVSKSITVD
jgi:glucosamine 6-phosphate synthetase-like amidotransferase/phosphosugar isomerase protein